MKQQDNRSGRPTFKVAVHPFKDNLQKDAGLLLAKEMKTQGYPITLENV